MPRTKTGNGNALTHGATSQRLHLDAAQRKEYEALRKKSFDHYRPSTPMRERVLEVVVSSMWLYELAEQHSQRRWLGEAQEEAQPVTPPVAQWFAANAHEARRAIVFLEAVKKAAKGGHVPECFHEELTARFGSEFLQTLLQWQTSDLFSVLLAQDTKEKAEMYPGLMPEILTERKNLQKTIKVVEDPAKKVQMLQKLIELMQAHVDTVARILAQESREMGSGATPLELAERYRVARWRQFERALKMYKELVEAEL